MARGGGEDKDIFTENYIKTVITQLLRNYVTFDIY